MTIMFTTIVIAIIIMCYIFYKWQVSKIKVHRHIYSKPIVSMYVSFNTRDIVYECKCGKRKIIRDYRPFHVPFPIETTNFITREQLEVIATKKKQKS